jgi:hypothetical protein
MLDSPLTWKMIFRIPYHRTHGDRRVGWLRKESKWIDRTGGPLAVSVGHWVRATGVWEL